jgi:hypothetical protein
MLERESDNVLDSFNRHGKRVSRKAFAYYNFDSTKVISRVPMVLPQKLLSKAGKSERL